MLEQNENEHTVEKRGRDEREGEGGWVEGDYYGGVEKGVVLNMNKLTKSSSLTVYIHWYFVNDFVKFYNCYFIGENTL